MIICCPLSPGPSNLPKREPPENIWLPLVGSSFATRTSTFFNRSPQQSARLKISTLSTLVAESPKSRASQGARSFSFRFEWQMPSCVLVFLSPSMHLAGGKSGSSADIMAVLASSFAIPFQIHLSLLVWLWYFYRGNFKFSLNSQNWRDRLHTVAYIPTILLFFGSYDKLFGAWLSFQCLNHSVFTWIRERRYLAVYSFPVYREDFNVPFSFPSSCDNQTRLTMGRIEVEKKKEKGGLSEVIQRSLGHPKLESELGRWGLKVLTQCIIVCSSWSNMTLSVPDASEDDVGLWVVPSLERWLCWLFCSLPRLFDTISSFQRRAQWQKKNFVGRRFLFLCVFFTGFITLVSL